MSPQPHPWWRLLLVVVVLAVAVGLVAILKPHARSPAPSVATPPLPHGSVPGASTAWLGLDYNSGAGRGGLNDFVARGIVYDREGALEVDAGTLATGSTALASGLAQAYGAGMVPDIEVDPSGGPTGCTDDPQPINYCLPSTPAEISAYAADFTATVKSVLEAYPRRQVLFEPMNEPWDWAFPPGTPSGRSAASEYAAVLVKILQSARTASVPLSDIYVPATGELADGSSWISDLYAAQPCLEPGPSTCGPIEGWTLHPYGLPNRTNEGIDSVPGLRAQMQSGTSNLVVSEIGFCANDVDGGFACDENQPDVVGSSAQAARWLTETLDEAARMHAAGWLKALMLWQRGGGGWAMQNPDGTLTAQGRALDLFADAQITGPA